MNNTEYGKEIIALTQRDLTLIITLTSVISIILLICALYFKVIIPFREEKIYIKSALYNSRSKHEYDYWKRELRNLYLKQIPILKHFRKKVPK